MYSNHEPERRKVRFESRFNSRFSVCVNDPIVVETKWREDIDGERERERERERGRER